MTNDNGPSGDGNATSETVSAGGRVEFSQSVQRGLLGVCYVATVLLGLAVTDEFVAAGIVAFEDPQSVSNVGVFAVEVLAVTGIIIAVQRLGLGTKALRVLFLSVFGISVGALVVALTGGTHVHGVPTSPVAVAVTLGVVVALWAYPEWYVIDAVAVVAGAALISMMGLSFGPFPVVVLLVAWAAYDAYAVYVSGHMDTLAESIGDLKAPLMYVVPSHLGHSFRDFDGFESDEEATDGDGTGVDGDGTGVDADGEGDDGEGDDWGGFALLGLGDSIIPGMLAVSAGQFLDAPMLVPALNANAPAVGALLGGVVGLVALFHVANNYEGTHAGLPPLNAGVLGGYLVGAVVAGVPITAALGL